MPINNIKGLEALRNLAEGGSAGLNAYKQAQAKETTSRTDALQGALGSNDVMAAAQKAQAQYSPKLNTGGLGTGDLSAAANSYLSQAANKLSAQQYEHNQDLAYQGEALARQGISDKDRMLQLQGASDIMAEGQREEAQKAAGGSTQLGDIAAQKAALRNQLTAYDTTQAAQVGEQVINPISGIAETRLPQTPTYGPSKAMRDLQMLQANSQSKGDVGQVAQYTKMMNDLVAKGGDKEVTGYQTSPTIGADQGLLGTAQRQTAEQNPDMRGDILRQMAGLDEQYKTVADQYAGFLGTDAKGLMDRYAQADQGNVDAVKSFLGEQGMKGMAAGALGQADRNVQMGEQARLRELAPSFGYDPLKAAGMFREGEGSALKQAQQLEAEQAYRSGTETPKQTTERYAAELDFPDAKAYSKVLGRTNMDNEEAASLMNTDAFKGLSAVAQENTLTGGDFEDFKSKIREYALAQPVAKGFDADSWKKEQAKLIELGIAYFQEPAKTTEEK